MPKFSDASKEMLAECHPDLQKLFNEVIKYFDFKVICGRRGEKEQNEAFENGMSKLKFPNSNHNSNPSMAVDVAPYPVDWKNSKRFIYFAGYVMALAKQMNLNIRWGGDWNRNQNPSDETFLDLPHFEIDEGKKTENT